MPAPKRKKKDPWDIFEDVKRTNKKYTQKSFIAIAILLGALLILDKTGLFGLSDIKQVFNPSTSENMEVHFIDVGQGDCELVIIGDNAILIDGGEKENGANISKYLDDNGVEKLDYVIATHPHSDHIGGIPEAVENIDVETFIIPDIPTEYAPTTLIYENLLEAVAESGADLEYAEVDTTYQLGKAEFTIIAPNRTYSELNNYSIVIWLEHGENSFIFTGDAEKKVEKDIIEDYELTEVDVFKCGHHGSDTSNSQEFLDILQPKYAVVECGLDNSYGHPDSDIIRRISKITKKIYRTDLNGNIIFTSDSKKITVKTDKK